MNKLFKVDKNEWMTEIEDVTKYYDKTFNSSLPKELWRQVDDLKSRIHQWNL